MILKQKIGGLPVSFNKFCAEDVLEQLEAFPTSKKRVLIQDLQEVLPQYTYETLQATCVELAKRGIINATTYKLKKEGERIRNIKLEPR